MFFSPMSSSSPIYWEVNQGQNAWMEFIGQLDMCPIDTDAPTHALTEVLALLNNYRSKMVD